MDSFYEDSDVRVLTMCPGPTDTPLLHNLEARSYDPALEKALVNTIGASSIVYQKLVTNYFTFLN